MIVPALWQRVVRRPYRGQTIVLFALVSLVLIGSLGLVLDGGYTYAQRRTMQNAADAAALAGAKALSGNNAIGFTVWATVKTVAGQNGVNDPTNSSQLTCVYLNNSGQPLTLPAACDDAAFPSGTNVSGVQVRAAESHRTFFMRALGILSSGSAATATARVETLSSLPNSQIPFLPCGINSKVVDASGNVVMTNGAHPVPVTLSILQTVPGGKTYTYLPGNANLTSYTASWQDASVNGVVKINPAAFSYSSPGNMPPAAPAGPNQYRFLIHKASGNDVQGIERCDADGYSAWKGFNGLLTGQVRIKDTLPLTGSSQYASPFSAATSPDSNNAGYTSGRGGLVQAGTGNRSGPAAAVPGAGGCAPGQSSNCILILPVLDNSVGSGNGSNGVLAARKFAAFYMTASNNGDEHWGALIDNYPITAAGTPDFTAGNADNAILSVRLIK